MKYLLTLLVAGLPAILHAQNKYGPNVIPPSPEASSIARYVDLQVSEYTGRVQQTVPIHTLVEGDLSLPISLDYQSGGVRIRESASWVGLQWNLTAGGAVTRTSRGVPDDIQGGFLQTIQSVDYNYLVAGPEDDLRYNYLKQIASGCDDAEPDLFLFNMNGIQGKFNFDWDGNIVVNANVKVKVEPIWSGSELGGWHIIGPDGTKYTFSAVERTTILSSSVVQCFISQIQHFNSSWFLTEIENASGNRSIRLEYANTLLQDHEIFHSYVRLYNADGNSACGGSSSDTWNTSNITIAGKRLSRIYSSYAPVEVRFIPGNTREDLQGDNLYELDEIAIYAGSAFRKKFVLEHDYSTGRLTLNSVQEKSGSSVINPYRFYYHTQDKLPSRSSNEWDAFGFFNKNTSNTVLPPHVINLFGTENFVEGANRTPDPDRSKSGVLYKVGYPTKGYHVYGLELNKYGWVNGQQLNANDVVTEPKYFELESLGTTDQCLGGGDQPADIKESTFAIKVHPYEPDSSRTVIVTIMSRVDPFPGDGEPYFGAGLAPKAELLNSDGELLASFSITSPETPLVKELTPGEYKFRTFAKFKCGTGIEATYDRAWISVSFEDFTEERSLGKPAGGVRVKEIKRYDKDSTLLSSTFYNYTLPEAGEPEDEDYIPPGFSSGFVYDEPRYQYPVSNFISSGGFTETECNGLIVIAQNRHMLGHTQGSHVGYKKVTVHEGGGNGRTELYFTTAPDLVYQTVPFRPPMSSSHKTGLLDIKNLLPASGSGQQYLEDNNYVHREISTRALKVNYKGSNGPLASRHFDLGPYQLILGNTKVSQSTLKQDNVETLTDYSYSGDLHFIKETKRELYTGGGVKKNSVKYFYPQDLLNPSGVLLNLKNKHIFNQPFEVVERVEEDGNNYVVGGRYFEYTDEYLRAVYELDTDRPISESQFTYAQSTNGVPDTRYATAPEVELTYNTSTDELTEQQQNGLSTAYLWNDEGLLTAQAINANNGQIFHTSFENSNGTVGSSKTGDRYWNSGSYNVQTQGGFAAPTGVDLLMSYWYWANNQWNYSGVQPYSPAISNGTRLDEIRVYPRGAQMTTYVVDPLDGMTAVTDANGQTYSYTYDALNRLIEEKDHHGDLLKYYEYQYSRQE